MDHATSRTPWLPADRDQWVLYATCVLLLVAMGVRGVVAHRAGSARASTTRATDRCEYRIDINRAGVAELGLLPGIGDTLAERIVQYRNGSGPFADTGALSRVRGLSAAKVEKLAPLIEAGSAQQGGEPLE